MKSRLLLLIGTLALGTSAFTAGVLYQKKTSHNLRNSDLAKSFALLQSDLDSQRRQAFGTLSRLYVDPANQPNHPLTGDPSDAASKEELETQVGKIREIILESIQANTASTPPTSALVSTPPLTVQSGTPLEWLVPEGYEAAGLSLGNPGPDTITNLSITLDGKKMPLTIEDIIRDASSDQSTDEEKALALWNYVSQNRRHDWPPHSGKEAFDPVKFLGVYGYGFCSHAAKALAVLANHAGLQSRVRHAKGQHVVCEILIDGRWAMFDPDGEVFYRNKQGKIASVDEIRSDPQLVLTSKSPLYPFEKLIDIFSHHEFIVIPYEKFGIPDPHSIQITLRPGESLVFSKQKKGLFFASRYLEVPEEYANGQWLYEPIWSADQETQLITFENVSLEETAGALAPVVSDPSSAASISIGFDLPYPILNAKMEFLDPPSENHDSIEVFYSRDGSSWRSTSVAQTKQNRIIQFPDFPTRLGGDPDYKWFVKLSIAPNSDATTFPKFRISMSLQMAPRSLPIPDKEGSSMRFRFKPSTENLNVSFLITSKLNSN